MESSLEDTVPARNRVLVAWFCPWAQRAWLVASLSNRNCHSSHSPDSLQLLFDIVQGDEVMVLETDNGGRGSRFHEVVPEPDGVSRLMLKGPLLGNLSVPAVLRSCAEPLAGDSIAISKWIWEHGCREGTQLDVGTEAQAAASHWSDLIAGPFYGALMNKGGEASKHCTELTNNISAFGEELKGPYFGGDEPSLVDIAVLPFVYRLFSLSLLRAFRSAEINEPLLQLLDTAFYRDPSTLDSVFTHRIAAVLTWLRHCMRAPWVADTLPPDAEEGREFCSQSLKGLYTIYAMGIGLKSVAYEGL